MGNGAVADGVRAEGAGVHDRGLAGISAIDAAIAHPVGIDTRLPLTAGALLWRYGLLVSNARGARSRTVEMRIALPIVPRSSRMTSAAPLSGQRPYAVSPIAPREVCSVAPVPTLVILVE